MRLRRDEHAVWCDAAPLIERHAEARRSELRCDDDGAQRLRERNRAVTVVVGVGVHAVEHHEQESRRDRWTPSEDIDGAAAKLDRLDAVARRDVSHLKT